jgi:hypothetical protein
VLLSSHNNNWDSYFPAIYAFFVKDFVEGQPVFRGKRLGLKRHPLIEGKEATFWHFISTGEHETDRIPDLRRCERIRWPRPVIENCDDGNVRVWENRRKNERRIVIWLEEAEYLVVLADRNGYLLPWTAYTVTEDHRKRKLHAEYTAYKKANAVQ